MHNATTNIFFRDDPKSEFASPQTILEETTGLRLGYKKRDLAKMN